MKSFYSIWLKQISCKEELKKRLNAKAKKLKPGQAAIFFINHKSYNLINENGRFIIKKK